MTTTDPVVGGASPPPQPMLDGRRSTFDQVLVYLFVVAPFLALAAATPVAWGWGLHWHDVVIAAVFYTVGLLGVTVGYHRCFTHGSFKPNRGLKIGLAVAGEVGFQGPPISWVGDHRRHHAFSDREGDPHSPWLFGTSPAALVRGFWHAHVGWLFDRDETNMKRFAPDLLADPDMCRVNSLFGWVTLVNLVAPAIIGGLWSWSIWGAVTAFFWAGLVRVAFLHHVTWSTNSVCHMIGRRPFKSRDKAANFWPLAILSAGESWHNLHHADPTSARHGVEKGQIDISARTIWLFEKLGWATNVRWSSPERVARLRVAEEAGAAA